MFNGLHNHVQVVSENTLKAYIPIIKFAIEAIVIIATILGTLFMEEADKLEQADGTNEAGMKKEQILSYVSCLLAGIIYILSALTSKKKLRIVPCPGIGCVCALIQTALQIQKILLTAAFVVMGYAFAYKVNIGNPLQHMDEIFVMVLVYGRIKRV